jgi:hypothetical protein
MNSRILKEFPGNFNRKKDFKNWKTLNSAWAEIGPRPGSTSLAQRPNRPKGPTEACRARSLCARLTRQRGHQQRSDRGGAAGMRSSALVAHEEHVRQGNEVVELTEHWGDGEAVI